MIYKYWLRERGKIPCYCPIDDDGNLVLGMNYIGDPPDGGAVVVVGEFWFTEDGELRVELNEAGRAMAEERVKK